MKEAQVHQALAKWLDSNRIAYVHSRTDRKHTSQVGDPDFFCLLAGRCCACEVKILGGKVSEAQQKRIDYLLSCGVITYVRFGLADCIEAISSHFGICNVTTHTTGADSWQQVAPMTIDAPPRPEFIMTVMGVDLVMTGQSTAGGTATKVRTASPQDLRELPRK